MRTRFRPWLFLTVGVAVAWALAPPCASRIAGLATASMSESAGAMVGHIPESGLNVPAHLDAGRDVYCLVTSGGAYTYVWVLGRPETDASRLAKALDGSYPWGRTVVYEDDPEYAVAGAAIRSGHLGQTASSTSVPLRSVLSALKAAGFTPHLIWRVSTYAYVAGLPAPKFTRSQFAWFTESEIPSGAPFVRVRLPLWQAAAVAIDIVVPLVNAALLLGGALIGWKARRTKTSPMSGLQTQARISCISLLLMVPTLIALPFTLTAMHKLSDLWYGETLGLPVIWLISGPTALLGLMMLAQRPGIKTPAAFTFGMPAPTTPEAAAAIKRRKWLVRIPQVAGWALLIAQPFAFASGLAGTLARIVAFSLIVFGSGAAAFVLRRPDRHRAKRNAPIDTA